MLVISSTTDNILVIALMVSGLNANEKKQLHSVYLKGGGVLGRKFSKNNTLRLNLEALLTEICICELQLVQHYTAKY